MPPKLPRTFLGATKKVGDREIPITEIELDHGVNAGIHLQIIGVDMVPLQEEHEARLERGIGLTAWGAMPMMEKALVIANRRVRIAMQNIHTEAEIKQVERESKRKRH